MIHLFRYLKGYLLVYVDAYSPERFLNLCRAKHIETWNLQNMDDKYYFHIKKEDYKKLKEIIRKTNVKIRIQKKIGLPFFMFKYRKHYSFAIGIILSVVMLYVMSLFVWDIGIEGNSMYTNNVILSYLNENKIKPGILVKNLNCNELESQLRNKFNDMTWVSAEIRGTRLILHIKENDGDEVKPQNNEISNIVSTKNGVVTSIITRKGVPKVAVGTEVTQGTVLVSGEVILYNDAKEPVKTNYVCSDADVFVKTEYDYDDELKLDYIKKKYTGRKISKKTFNILGKQIETGLPFQRFKNYDVLTEDTVVHLTENFYLPVRTGKKIYEEYDRIETTYTEDEAKKILTHNYSIYLKKLEEKGIQIIDSSVKIETTGEKYTMKGQIQVIEKMTERETITPSIQQEKDEGSQ